MATKIDARDFLNIRQQIIDYMKSQLGDRWTDTGESDELSVMADAVAHVADNLHYYIDFQKKEASLATATHEKNVISLATGYGYRPRMRVASRGFVKIILNSPLPENLIIKKGTVFTTSDGLTRSDNLPVSVIKTTEVLSDAQEFNVEVAQGEFINLKMRSTDIVPGGRLYLDSSYVAEGFTTLTHDGINWELVDDVYTEDRVGRYFSVHIDIQDNLERYYIQLPYNYTTYITSTSTLDIEYLQTQGSKGIIAKDKVDTMVEPLVTTKERDITGWVEYLGNTESILGGNDRESPSSIKTNTINYLRSLESLVTIRDYSDFASSYVGKSVSAVDWRTAPDLVKVPYKIMIIADLDESSKKDLLEQLHSRQARPDEIEIVSPIEVPYNITVTVYVRSSNTGEETIKSAINDAILQDIVDRSEYGKSLWLSNIYWCVQNAHEDIVRVTIESPSSDVEVTGYQIPKLNETNITFKVMGR